MCGIALVHSKREKIKHRLLSVANEELGIRGPTSCTHYLSNDVYMFQSILAIQSEPKDRGFAQLPHHYDVTLYNGEIYDADENEIIKDVNRDKRLASVDGMFSIVNVKCNGQWFDVNAYRDLIGEKRLYYYDSKNLFVIASTPRFIFEVMRLYGETQEIDTVALQDYYVMRHGITNKTGIRGVEMLPPGSKLTYNKRGVKIEKLWSTRQYLRNDLTRELCKIDFDTYVSQLHELLSRTMRNMHQKVRPNIDTFSVVSGGVDSSLVTYYAENCGIDIVSALTLTFDGKDTIAQQAHHLFKHLECRQWSENVDRELYYDAYLESLRVCLEPISSHDFASAYVLYGMTSPGSIIYTGDCADEIFLGYKYYSNCITSEYALPVRSDFKYQRLQEIEDDYEYAYHFFMDNKYTSRDAHAKAASFIDVTYQVPNSTLLSADLIGGAHGVEVRTPFIRKHMLEYGLNSPIHLTQNKKGLNELFAKSFNKRAPIKQGFSGHPNAMFMHLDNIDEAEIIFGTLTNKGHSMSTDVEWKYINTQHFINSIYHV